MERCSVIIISYSAVCRSELSHIVASDPVLKLQAAVASYDQAFRILDLLTPDLVIAEIDIYPQQALEFLQKIAMHHRNVIALYSLHTPYQTILDKMVSYGMREYVQLPEGGLKEYFENNREVLHQKIKKMAKSVVAIKKKYTKKYNLVVMGASMGGTVATEQILAQLGQQIQPIVVVQHMKEFMLPEYVRRLNDDLHIKVKLAEDEELLLPGYVYVAPGGCHTLVRRRGNKYTVELRQGPAIGNHLPAVDVLFKSVADEAGDEALGIILTGMGEDGALGITQMYNQGAMTVAQDEASSTVFGMPRAAIMYGGIDRILPLNLISKIITERASVQ